MEDRETDRQRVSEEKGKETCVCLSVLTRRQKQRGLDKEKTRVRWESTVSRCVNSFLESSNPQGLSKSEVLRSLHLTMILHREHFLASCMGHSCCALEYF